MVNTIYSFLKIYIGDILASRKIQLVAGSTYSVSLPKEWVRRNGLKEGKEIHFNENGDGSLSFFLSEFNKNRPSKLSFDIDQYTDGIDQLLFATYYSGISEILLDSKNGISKDDRKAIHNTITKMSGTEIKYEDSNKVEIKCFLDESKVNIKQILYRICLILEMTIQSTTDNSTLAQASKSEEEIDRLYHLAVKIITLSLLDSKILNSSGIKNSVLIPAYFLIFKKLENIGDSTLLLTERIIKEGKLTKEETADIILLAKEIKRCASFIQSDKQTLFERFPSQKEKDLLTRPRAIAGNWIQQNIENIARAINDVEEELLSISIYTQFMQDKIL